MIRSPESGGGGADFTEAVLPADQALHRRQEELFKDLQELERSPRGRLAGVAEYERDEGPAMVLVGWNQEGKPCILPGEDLKPADVANLEGAEFALMRTIATDVLEVATAVGVAQTGVTDHADQRGRVTPDLVNLYIIVNGVPVARRVPEHHILAAICDAVESPYVEDIEGKLSGGMAQAVLKRKMYSLWIPGRQTRIALDRAAYPAVPAVILPVPTGEAFSNEAEFKDIVRTVLLELMVNDVVSDTTLRPEKYVTALRGLPGINLPPALNAFLSEAVTVVEGGKRVASNPAVATIAKAAVRIFLDVQNPTDIADLPREALRAKIKESLRPVFEELSLEQMKLLSWRMLGTAERALFPHAPRILDGFTYPRGEFEEVDAYTLRHTSSGAIVARPGLTVNPDGKYIVQEGVKVKTDAQGRATGIEGLLPRYRLVLRLDGAAMVPHFDVIPDRGYAFGQKQGGVPVIADGFYPDADPSKPPHLRPGYWINPETLEAYPAIQRVKASKGKK